MTVTLAPFVQWADALHDIDTAPPDRLPVLADTRWYWDRSGLDAYDAGHVPGAVHVDLEAHLSGVRTATSGRHPLPTPEQFAAAMNRIGVSNDCRVYAYDDAGGVIAARLVWMLRALDVDAAVISGGLPAFVGALTSDEEAHNDRGPRTVSRPGTPAGSERPGVAVAAFEPRPWPMDLLADTTDIARDLTQRQFMLVDARPPDRFHGRTPSVDPRLGVVPQADPQCGHIPGAVNVPCRDNIALDEHIRPRHELATRFTAAGLPVRPADMSHVVAYCGAGVTACHNLLAIEHAGLGRARLYPGSWSAWSRTSGLPVATE